MPRKSPPVSAVSAACLQGLGAAFRAQRKLLRVSSTAAAEAAGVSRVTLHRIENGEASVAMGAWCNVAAALGLQLQAHGPMRAPESTADTSAGLPVEVVLSEFPQLKSLAWQVQGVNSLTPAEAYDIYERNARHLDLQAMTPQEHSLWQALQRAFAKGGQHV